MILTYKSLYSWNNDFVILDNVTEEEAYAEMRRFLKINNLDTEYLVVLVEKADDGEAKYKRKEIANRCALIVDGVASLTPVDCRFRLYYEGAPVDTYDLEAYKGFIDGKMALPYSGHLQANRNQNMLEDYTRLVKYLDDLKARKRGNT